MKVFASMFFHKKRRICVVYAVYTHSVKFVRELSQRHFSSDYSYQTQSGHFQNAKKYYRMKIDSFQLNVQSPFAILLF